MSANRIMATLLVLSLLADGSAFIRAGDAQPTLAAVPDPAPSAASMSSMEPTPPRVSYIHGEVSFWRPGAQDWAPARVNTPLAPGDVLYTGEDGAVELQVGPRAFVRAAEGTRIGLDNQEPDFVQLRVIAGQAGVDLRQLSPGSVIELDTPQAAFSIERAGYYRVNVDQDSTAFSTHRGGTVTMTAPGGGATPIASNQRVVLAGLDSPRVELGAAPELTAWDRWNYQRTNYLVQTASARYTSPAMYGTEALDQYGSWRTVENYGAVWVPTSTPAGWVPYSTGRWIWDPRFGWTWLDDAPWGWAPYHHGRWVFVGSFWAWAPGPIVVRPVYAPALVVFLGGVTISVGRPVCWAPLGWGEPLIPWWGRPGFLGAPWWGGWGGPRVVNNVVINRTTTVNVTNITVYKHVNVTRAVVGVPADRFGQGQLHVTRISPAEVQQLTPVRGALDVKPAAASVMPATGPAPKPSPAVHARSVVATRPPRDLTPALHAQGLVASQAAAPAPAPRLVPSPTRAPVPARVPEGRGVGKAPDASPGGAATVPGGPDQRKARRPERATPPVLPGAPESAGPGQPRTPGRPQDKSQARERPLPPPPPPRVTAPQHRETVAPNANARPEPRANHPVPPPGHATRPAGVEPPGRPEHPERGEPPARGERPDRR
jgi:hypothetical protein